MRFAFTIAILVAAGCPILSHAAEGTPHRPKSARTCYVKIGDASKQLCSSVFYLRGPAPRSVSIGTKTDKGDFSFAGKEIDANTFAVNSLYVDRPLKGYGTCKLAISGKGRVSKIDCKAETEVGTAILKSSGDDPNDIDVTVGDRLTPAEYEKCLHNHPSSHKSTE